jgi:hypothetical protein
MPSVARPKSPKGVLVDARPTLTPFFRALSLFQGTRWARTGDPARNRSGRGREAIRAAVYRSVARDLAKQREPKGVSQRTTLAKPADVMSVDGDEPRPPRRFALKVAVELGFGGYTVEGELRHVSTTGAYLMSPTTATVGTLMTLTFDTEDGQRAEVAGRTGRFVGLDQGVMVAIDFVGANGCFLRWAEAVQRGEAPVAVNPKLRIR